MTEHTPREQLSAYVDEQVVPHERRRIEAHLQGCEFCRAAVAELRRTIALIRGLEPVPAPMELRAAVRRLLDSEARARPGMWAWILGSRGLPVGRSLRMAGAVAAILLVGLFSLNLWRQAAPVGEQAEQQGSGPQISGVPAGTGATPPRPVELRTSGEVQTAGEVQRAAPLTAGPDNRPAAPAAVATFGRQVIRAASLSLEVADFDHAANALLRIAETGGGFIESTDVSSQEPPSGTFRLRVQAPRFSQTVDAVERLGEVETRQIQLQNVDNSSELAMVKVRLREKRKPNTPGP